MNGHMAHQVVFRLFRPILLPLLYICIALLAPLPRPFILFTSTAVDCCENTILENEIYVRIINIYLPVPVYSILLTSRTRNSMCDDCVCVRKNIYVGSNYRSLPPPRLFFGWYFFRMSFSKRIYKRNITK